MKYERNDIVVFIHGIINLIWPIFAYDLAELASLIIWGYSWTAAVPVTIMLVLPILSSLVNIVASAIQYYRRQSVLALLALIFSIAGLALYYVLRMVLQFSFGWLDPII